MSRVLDIKREELYTFALMLFFVFVTYIFANFVVTRDLDHYIEQKSRYLLQQRLQRDIGQNIHDAKMEYQSYKKYEPYLRTIFQTYDSQTLRMLLSYYFDVEDIKLLDRSGKEPIRSLYEVHLSMESPKSFFVFLQDLDKQAYPITFEYPIRFEKAQDKVAATLYLSLYTFR